MKKHRMFRWTLILFLVMSGICVQREKMGAKVLSDQKIQAIFSQAIENEELDVCITQEKTFALDAETADREARDYAELLLGLLQEAANKNGKILLSGNYSYLVNEKRDEVTYKFLIGPQNLREVTMIASEKQAYTLALKALKNRDYKTQFYTDESSFYEIFKMVLKQHPEYNYGVQVWNNTNGTFGFRQGSALSASSAKKYRQKADARANAIIKKIISPTMSRKEKIQAIHDYIVKNCAYDTGKINTKYDHSYTAYGCLVKKQAVCQGYAAAFNLLAGKAGIASITATGSAGGGSHAWNYVKDGSNYVHVDCTWDDPVPDHGKNASVPHKYFYVRDVDLKKTHKWKRTEISQKYITYTALMM